MQNNFESSPKRFMVCDEVNLRLLKLLVAFPDVKFITSKMQNEIIYELEHIFVLCRQCDMTHLFLVQSTGLYDKDGKEIFEGSIVDNGYCRSFCMWDKSDSSFCFILIKGHDNVEGFLDEYKVIGHTLLNTELLEDK